MKLPIILTNYKNYPSALGDAAIRLSELHAEAQKETGVTFGVAVSALDLRQISGKFGSEIPVFAEHIDEGGYGSSTGKIVPEEVKKAGAFGTLLNHSEDRVNGFELLGKRIQRAKEAGLFVIVCAETDEEGAKIMEKFHPDLIAVEPPELIGGDISVSSARPELISESVRKIGAGKVLVGAGVKNGEDVKIALELGAVGVLLASGVTKAEDQKRVLLDLVSKIGK
ncbi:triose-phosphate isomerase [Candidatus Peregrinibacteria bacterium]|nr:triose-phosphate isomerase [Candidatus Peregrinibacteria bacterium]